MFALNHKQYRILVLCRNEGRFCKNCISYNIVLFETNKQILIKRKIFVKGNIVLFCITYFGFC